MKQLLLLILSSYLGIAVTAQSDSISAEYVKTIVDRIESNLAACTEMGIDTTIVDDKGNMTVHTSFFIDRSGQVVKIMERSLFGLVSTEIVVYYNARSAILFSTKQWQGSQLQTDFDFYFRVNNPVYLVKRAGKGSPDGVEILKWCSQLLRESENKSLVKMNEGTLMDEKETRTKQKETTTKKSLFPFFKKKKQ